MSGNHTRTAANVDIRYGEDSNYVTLCGYSGGEYPDSIDIPQTNLPELILELQMVQAELIAAKRKPIVKLYSTDGMTKEMKAALNRPDNYFKIPESSQWGIDQELGILDWDGTCGHAGKGQMCGSCTALINDMYS